MAFGFFEFINPWLWPFLLLGIALPIIAHLLSKRRYDVVQWGAMQFLELGRKARRKILLEQLLLMLLRIALLSLLAFALMRPWLTGSTVATWEQYLVYAIRAGLFGVLALTLFKPLGGRLGSPRQLALMAGVAVLFGLTFLRDAEAGGWARAVSDQKRDVVLIVDGSYSMGWEGRSVTPHKAAIQFANHFLDSLGTGDAVALIDARDEARVVIESPTRDRARVREALSNLPPPAGGANLPDALRKAVHILSRSSNLSREIVVITDAQAKSWRADDSGLWARYDDLLEQPTVRPRTWAVQVGEQNAAGRMNFFVDRLTLNRELTAVGFPLRIKTKVGFTGGGDEQPSRKVHLEVDGQRLAGKTQVVEVKQGNEASVEFEHVFDTPGSHYISVVLDSDNLPGDNRADAAVVVTQAVPVLLVDGDPHPARLILSETAFAHSALTPEDNKAPWVKADVVDWRELDGKLPDLAGYDAVFLANVPRFTPAQIKALTDYVANGGGVFFALGDRIDRAHYNDRLFAQGRGLLPAFVDKLIENRDETKQVVQVLDGSLEDPLMERFRKEQGGGFCDVRFSHRWFTRPAETPKQQPAPQDPPQDGQKPNANGEDKRPTVALGNAIVLARLNTAEKDPLLITRRFGRGRTALLTSAIDGDWSTFPGKRDYTPFLHEIVFHLASARSSRNVEVGMPLLLEVPEKQDIDGWTFFGPGETAFDFTTGGILNGRKIVRQDNTAVPGLYAFRRKTQEGKPDPGSTPEYFVVNFDRGESDLTPLNDDQKTALQTSSDKEVGTRMAFVADVQDLAAAMFKDETRTEFWKMLMFVFLAILVFETIMTRKMVQGGHDVPADVVPDGELQPVEPLTSGGPPPLPAGAGRRQSVVTLGEDDFLDETEFAPAPRR